MDVFELEVASDAQISPDGEHIVYVRTFSDIGTDRRYSNLWIVDFDGTDHRPLTSGLRHDALPRWSPNGDRLAWVTEEETGAQIWARWMDSGQSTPVTRVSRPPQSIAWSPDGTRIAFQAHVPDPVRTIGDLPQPPAGAEWAPPAKVIDQFIYRFDQVGYLEPGRTQLFVVSSEGGTARQLTSGGISFGGPGLRASTLSWTPDGSALLVNANPRSDADHEPLDSEVLAVSLTDGAIESLTDRRGPDAGPVASPDGSRIAYTGFDDRYQGYQRTLLYVMDHDGGEARAISGSLDRSVSSPVWTADGRNLLFAYDSEGTTRIGRIAATGGAVTEVAAGLGNGTSAYSGGAFSLSRNGRYAYAGSATDRPSDIVVGSLDASPRTITRINADLLEQRSLGTVEEIWWESSFDGRRIQGWIVKPPDFDRDRRYPLILEIHGGPFAAYGPSFDLEKQLMAAAGYVVLYSNPRGSTSYGEEFGNLIHHAYPGDDFHDLDSGVDAVLELGYTDPDRIYVTGGSGGGVLTAWMIAHSERFRAAVSLYPVINWYSWVLTADIPSFGTKYWFPGLPWDHPDHYESRSLLSVVRNVETPTMVLTGEDDFRTPMSESEQYYTALQLLGVESVLVRFPEEPHGTRRRPSHHVQKVGLIVGWFDEHAEPKTESAAPTGP